MRLRRRTARSGFLQEVREWLEHPAGFLQFLVALTSGFLLTLFLLKAGLHIYWRMQAETTPTAETPSSVTPALEKLTPTAAESRALPELEIVPDPLDAEQWKAWATGEALPEHLRAVAQIDGQSFAAEIHPLSTLEVQGTPSLEVTLQEGTFLGMHSFAITPPDGRFREWVYRREVARWGLLSLPLDFATLRIEGLFEGPVALEALPTASLLTAQGRPTEGAIISADGKVRYASTSAVAAEAGALWDGFRQGKVAVEDTFDAKALGTMLALNNLWGGCDHERRWPTLYFYNASEHRLEPMACERLLTPMEQAHFVDLAPFDSLEVFAAYHEAARRINAEGYVESLQALVSDESIPRSLVESTGADQADALWDVVLDRRQILWAEQHPPQLVYLLAYHDPVTTSLHLQIANVVHLPVYLESLNTEDFSLSFQPEWVAAGDRAKLYSVDGRVLHPAPLSAPAWIDVYVPADALPVTLTQVLQAPGLTAPISLTASLYGSTMTESVEGIWDYPQPLTQPVTPRQPAVEEALRRYPFLSRATETGYLELRPGTWDVDGDLILPDGWGLRATGGTTLRFERGAILYANAPLSITATPEHPVRLLPQQRSWDGVIVLQAAAPSLLQGVAVSGTRGIARAGWMATGGVTFYESNVTIRDSAFFHSVGEDTVNVVRSTVTFERTTFEDIVSDAFDGDFVRGRVQDCEFENIRGDGIDVSGSHLRVENVVLHQVYDKGISAGEHSWVTATHIVADGVSMALASKDLSSLQAEDVRVNEAWIAALAAYQKKDEYGPARVSVEGLQLAPQVPKALVQTGSVVTVNGTEMAAHPLDIPAFYTFLEHFSEHQRLSAQSFLLGYRLENQVVAPGQPLRFSLYWQEVPPEYHPRSWEVALVNAEGNVAAQAEFPWHAEGDPHAHWVEGQVVEQPFAWTLSPTLPLGRYTLQVQLHRGMEQAVAFPEAIQVAVWWQAR